MKRIDGFTLIEIMVVIFILSVVLTFVTLSISSGQLESKNHEFQSEKMRSIIDALQTRAIIQSIPYAIVVEKNRAHIMRFSLQNNRDTWLPVTEDNLQLKLASDILLSVTGDLPGKIVFYGDGVISNFDLSATQNKTIVFACHSHEAGVECHI